jgi:hypothetical protein
VKLPLIPSLFSSHSSPFSPLPGVHIRRRGPRHPRLLPWCLRPDDRDLGGHLLAAEVDLRGNEERGVDGVDQGKGRQSSSSEPPEGAATTGAPRRRVQAIAPLLVACGPHDRCLLSSTVSIAAVPRARPWRSNQALVVSNRAPAASTPRWAALPVDTPTAAARRGATSIARRASLWVDALTTTTPRARDLDSQTSVRQAATRRTVLRQLRLR